MPLLLLATMFFFHLIDDYKLQGILANFKQKEWWRENAPDEMYEYDYITALIEHAFSWTFSIHIPVFAYACINQNWRAWWVYLSIFVLNWILHALVDNLKANERVINLRQDQTAHFLQILVTWVVYAF